MPDISENYNIKIMYKYILYYIYIIYICFSNIIIDIIFIEEKYFYEMCSDKHLYDLHKHQLFENKRGYSWHLFAM